MSSTLGSLSAATLEALPACIGYTCTMAHYAWVGLLGHTGDDNAKQIFVLSKHQKGRVVLSSVLRYQTCVVVS